jgi:hypothetical protein
MKRSGYTSTGDLISHILFGARPFAPNTTFTHVVCNNTLAVH